MTRHCLVEVTQQQTFTVSIEAENPLQAVELVHSLQGELESEQPPELLPEKSTILRCS